MYGFCNVWVCMGFVMCVCVCVRFVICGYLGNICTCIYCAFYSVLYGYLFLFVTSVRTTATE